MAVRGLGRVLAGCGAAVPTPAAISTPRQAGHPAPGDVPLQGDDRSRL